MNRAGVWTIVVLTTLTALMLSACSSRRCCCPPRNNCCAPPPCPPPCPPVTAQMPTPPPAPEFPADPGYTQTDLDAIQQSLEQERARSEALADEVRRANDRAEQEAERARTAEEMLATVPTQTAPAPGMAPMPAPAAGGVADQLACDLRARSAAEVVQEGNIVIVRMSNAFRPGSDLLKKDVQLITTLNATADALNRYPGASVAIVGHSDTDKINKSRKRWGTNEELSRARAARVAQVLSENGVQSARMQVDGVGAREPLVFPERSAADKARNRRVEITIRL